MSNTTPLDAGGISSSSSPPPPPAMAPAMPTPRRPSLLPAFEPVSSSSPALPRSTKRKLDDTFEDRQLQHYPTPVPTSSTGILPSSPPSRSTRPGLQRTVSTLSERAPLGDVPTLPLLANGEPLLLGRSSNSSDYQLPGNRQISRVHIRACYRPPTVAHPAGTVEVECLGWNGAKVHCRGEVIELQKGGVYRSETVAQIMLDVQETRVMLTWPKDVAREPLSAEPRSPWAVGSSNKRRAVSASHIPSSPPPMLPLASPNSPLSPTPAIPRSSTFLSTFCADAEDGEVQVYEDHSSDEDAPHDPTPEPDEAIEAAFSAPTPTAQLQNGLQSAVPSEQEEFSEHDEENDPIVHSFGPFGDNILSRFQSFPPQSPERKRVPLEKSSFNSPGRSPSKTKLNPSPIKNHVINQLAFSRVHSLPLSQIHSALPTELRGAMAKPSDTENRHVLSASELKSILDGIPCVGEIAREGKDAHGKLLESEFYYVPEMDQDEMRRNTVTQSLGKTSIRAARKQHKQYYWKKPR